MNPEGMTTDLNVSDGQCGGGNPENDTKGDDRPALEKRYPQDPNG